MKKRQEETEESAKCKSQIKKRKLMFKGIKMKNLNKVEYMKQQKDEQKRQQKHLRNKNTKEKYRKFVIR